MSPSCTHLKQVRTDTPRTPDGCEECLKAKSRWVHLRLCLKCGHVGCCDSSPALLLEATSAVGVMMAVVSLSHDGS